jgi:predicted TIM-barrel fold metal-dependent hydrolase
MNSTMALADLLFSPVFQRFTDLKIALSEGGIGWVPYLLERADYVYHHHHKWTGTDLGGRLPSQIFRDHVMTCFIDDAFGVANREAIGIDNITWECDYPHSDSTWPTSPETLGKSLVGVADADVRKIGYENALKLFQFDPFSSRPRDTCTVAALRAEALDVDVELRHTNRTHSTMTGQQLAELSKKLTLGDD